MTSSPECSSGRGVTEISDRRRPPIPRGSRWVASDHTECSAEARGGIASLEAVQGAPALAEHPGYRGASWGGFQAQPTDPTTLEEALVGGGADNVILPVSAAAMLRAMT
jgi:hypothetical protein